VILSGLISLTFTIKLNDFPAALTVNLATPVAEVFIGVSYELLLLRRIETVGSRNYCKP
jgi:hypothetical protein